MVIFHSYVSLPEGNKTLANDTKNAKNYIYIIIHMKYDIYIYNHAEVE